MRIVVLGAAAGGGFPQWNCNCPNCRRVRADDPATRARTQCSLAVSDDGRNWLLLNASPDLRQQISSMAILHPDPSQGPRHSPIRAVLLTGGDVDACVGLINLREGQAFDLYAAAPVLDILDRNALFDVLAPEKVSRHRLPPGEARDLGFGLRVETFSVPGKLPLYLEREGGPLDLTSEGGEAIGVRVSATGGGAFFFIPGCARLSDGLRRRLEGAELVFFDGTLWADDEMIRLGLGTKTGRRMGHMSMSGPEGSIAAFADLDVHRKVFVHINNTNPVLIDGSPEAEVAAAAGWEIAGDGMEIVLS